MKRRAALELSMQSIIIFVLAIIVMASLVVAVRTILNKVSPEQIDETIGSQQVPFKTASYDQPLTIGTSGNQIKIKSIDTKQIGFDLYALQDISAGTRLTFTLEGCMDEEGNEKGLSLTLSPYLVDRDLQPGDTLGGGVITIKARGVEKGTYTCLLKATAEGNDLAQRTVILTVT